MRVWVLPALMLLGALLGLLLGGTVGHRWTDPSLEPLVLFVRLLGVVFLSILKALIVPLVVTSIVVAVTGMGDLRKFGRAAAATCGYFVSTTFLAVITGMVLVSIIAPGSRGGAAPGEAATSLPAAANQSAWQAIYDILTGMFPPNIAAAAVEGNILGLIVFSIAIGIVLAWMGERSRGLVDLLVVANEALLAMVRFVVWLAPIGILGLVADRVGKAGGGAAVWTDLQRLAWYAATVLIGLAIHSLVLSAIVQVLAKKRARAYVAGMSDALVTALGTASSAATMAVTLRCVTENNGVGRRAADLVIPLGTTVNMDGTALYEAVAVIFIAQAMGVELSLAQHGLIAITATLAAIGAAAIPEAGLVTMVLVLGAIGLPAEGIGLLLSIDWLLDRFRTTVNVWGDSVGAALIDRMLASPRAA
jgi:Na+/H+-dicarboxylate symporter